LKLEALQNSTDRALHRRCRVGAGSQFFVERTHSANLRCADPLYVNIHSQAHVAMAQIAWIVLSSTPSA